jgi:hypothetical protein
MSDLFREVDEEIRKDKATEFWFKHGTKLVLAATLIIAGVAGWQAYTRYEFGQRAALGAAFEAAMAEANAEKPEATASLTTLAEGKTGTYPALARFRLASDLARKAQDEAGRKDAASAFDALAKDAALPTEWQELASLRAAYVLLDDAPLADIEARLTPLMAAGKPFRHSAREALALAAWRVNNQDRALEILQQVILDTETPQNMRQRAEAMLAVVRAGAVK